MEVSEGRQDKACKESREEGGGAGFSQSNTSFLLGAGESIAFATSYPTFAFE
jgi:hypothetical protein